MQTDVTVERTVQTPCGELAVERAGRVADPATMVIFGATGDLAKRKLLPALYNLNADRLLPERFAVVGLGLEALTTEADRDRVSRDLQQFGGGGRRAGRLRLRQLGPSGGRRIARARQSRVAAAGAMTAIADPRLRPGAWMTFARDILESQRQHPLASGELSIVLLQRAFDANTDFTPHGFCKRRDVLRQCAEACRRCAATCREMAA